MQVQRRGFLGGVVALLAGGRSALTAEAAGLAGLSVPLGLGAGVPGAYGSPPSDGDGIPTDDDWVGLGRMIAANGIPDFRMRDICRQAQRVSALDPDLAAMRSWSLSARIAVQRERQLARLVAEFHRAVDGHRVAAAFVRRHRKLAQMMPWVG